MRTALSVQPLSPLKRRASCQRYDRVMRQTRAVYAIVAVVWTLVALILPSCTAAQPADPVVPSSEQPAITGPPAAFNADDVAFASAMITYHRQAVDLSTLATAQSSDDALISLASDIGAQHKSDVEVMKVLLLQWNAESEVNPDPGGRGNATGLGVIDGATMARLQSLSGAEFDTLWLQLMIANNRAALTVTQTEIDRGANVDAVATAKRNLNSLQSELQRSEQLLGAR